MLMAICSRKADVAAIDAVSFAHIARGEPALAARVRTIDWTDASPGLPFVTSIATPIKVVDLVREAIGHVASSAEARPACDVLLLAGIERLPQGAYDGLLRMERDAVRLHYPELA